jgi:Leucine rich repeat/Leucine Rich repeats (2 copies)/Leucine Rich Repeat
MRILLSTLLLFLSYQSVYGQIEFSSEQLKDPNKFADEIRAHFDEQEIELFDTTFTSDHLGNKIFLLRNGLRSSNYLHINKWLAIRDSAEIVSIDIVFSKYPNRKNNYQMNMPLLFNRLKKLFIIDSQLNSEMIEWNIVLQTDCRFDEQVDSLFHGVVIHYSLPSNDLHKEEKYSDSLDAFTAVIQDQDSEEERLIRLELMSNSDYLPDSISKLLEGKNVAEKEQIIADYYWSTLTEEEPDISAEYLDERRTEVEDYIYSYGGSSDQVVKEVLDRNPQWKNSLVVSDWTGSMYGYGAQVLEWHIDNFEKSGIHFMTLFNDGDRKKIKNIGETEGIYHVDANEMKNVVNLYRFVMTKGGGGDGPENDLEGILKAMEHFDGGYDEIILIADNNSCVRDMSLLDNIDIPIQVIICGYNKKIGVNPQYLEIAFKTGGSVHTIEEDLYDIDAELDKKGKLKMKGSDLKIGNAPCIGSWFDMNFFVGTVFTNLKNAKKNKKVAIHLDISYQKYKRLKTTIYQIKKLRTLNISHNEISKIPQGIHKLRELKSFDCSFNKIDKIPENIAKIAYIKKLNFSHNQISEIPKTLLRLRFLNELDLSFNLISTLPNPALMKKLRILDLSHNSIQSLPKLIGKLTKLEQLNLSNNGLTSLPSTIGKLKNLEILDLSNNNIDKVPIKLARLRNLKVLILSGNPIKKKDLMRLASYLKGCKIIL